jgi:hypothetical protein
MPLYFQNVHCNIITICVGLYHNVVLQFLNFQVTIFGKDSQTKFFTLVPPSVLPFQVYLILS